MEDPHGYMHVASVGIFEPGPLALPGGGIDFDAIRAQTEAMLHHVPRYRQKLQWTPLSGSPVWVDDRSFNLNYHMRHTSLPHPGTLRQLKRMSARIMSQHLDRSKPLWETWVVEGLEDGRFAIISKTHHCMIDGVSGVDLATILMSTKPDPEIPDPPPYVPREAPSGWELLRDEAVYRALLPFQVLRDVRAFARDADDLRRELETRARALAESLGWLRPRSRTPFNAPIGGHRRFDWTATEIDDIRTIRKGLGGSLNDVVLATVTGAVRAFLESRGENVGSIRFRVMAPVSVRSETEHGALGNRVAAWLIELPVGEPDPRKRVAAIREQTEKLKDSKQAVAAEMLTRVADWTPAGLLSLGTQRAKGLIPFNMVVTNVPGPQMPLYMVGAKLVESYPVVPITGDLGLGIALFSYCGRLFWGFSADWELLPDLHTFVERIEDAFDELMRAAGAEVVREEPSAPPREPRDTDPLPRELVLLRHAKSDWGSGAPTDFERPLDMRGTRDAPRVGRWLEVCGLTPDHVVSSPAARARQTTDAALAGMGSPTEEVHTDERVYEASLQDLLDVLRDCPRNASRVMIVGHNPGFELLVEHLAGRPIPPPAKGKLFPTAAVAHLRMPADWGELERGTGELVAIMRPRDLPASTPARTAPDARSSRGS